MFCSKTLIVTLPNTRIHLFPESVEKLQMFSIPIASFLVIFPNLTGEFTVVIIYSETSVTYPNFM